ncbi:MAG: hypothetical protein JST47_06605 [Bacteroidetes bacterium]|nr:hypothetical protein [Bacteroidota bacterium]MBS1972921.1 hypothetical protein [Bacteroidota bacterium]
MKIAALANEIARNEILQKPAVPGVSWVWADSIEGLMNIANASAYFDFEFQNQESRVAQLKKLAPSPVFINSVTSTIGQIRQPFIRMNAWPGFLGRPIIEVSVLHEDQKKGVENIFLGLNWQFRFVPDISGMISARILAMIINEAYYALQDKVSTKEEIDVAMKWGTSYPLGPFEWGRKIGLSKVYDLLNELSKNDSRYSVSEALKKELE